MTWREPPLLTLRLDTGRLQAYQAAADRSGMSRQTWILEALDVAAGIRDRRVRHKPAPRLARPTQLSKVRGTTTTIDTDVGGIGPQRRTGWMAAAAKTGIPTARWAVVVLDAAAGISELAEQLWRISQPPRSASHPAG